jgi:acetate kinase
MTVGAYFTLLEGRAALVFGGGIGSHSPEIRARVAAGLRAWDLDLDPELNARSAPGRISAPGARAVYVFRTNEEQLIAREVARLLGLSVFDRIALTGRQLRPAQ